MTKKYILRDKKPILEPDIIKWAMWIENADRHVSKTTIQSEDGKEYRVSTVFLGLDHRFFSNDGMPILFETMIFVKDGNSLDYQERYSTWDEAEKGHEEAIKYLKELLTNKKE